MGISHAIYIRKYLSHSSLGVKPTPPAHPRPPAHTIRHPLRQRSPCALRSDPLGPPCS